MNSWAFTAVADAVSTTASAATCVCISPRTASVVEACLLLFRRRDDNYRHAQAPSDKQHGRVGIPPVGDSASQHGEQPELNENDPSTSAPAEQAREGLESLRVIRFPPVTWAVRRAPGASPRCRVIGSAAGRSLRQNRALGWPVNRFLRDVAIGVIRQWDRRSNADDAAQQDIQRD